LNIKSLPAMGGFFFAPSAAYEEVAFKKEGYYKKGS
jgi:hypothetical protein